MLIIILLRHYGCDCIMSTYSNMSIAGTEGDNTVCGWGRVSVAWVGLPQKVREMSGNFTWTSEWSPCIFLSRLSGSLIVEMKYLDGH